MDRVAAGVPGVPDGTQILAAFLLTLPFQQRFSRLSGFQIGVYLVLVFLAVAITLLALTPVSLHRLLFRQGMKKRLVHISNVVLLISLAGASLLFTGIVLFVVDVLVGAPASEIAAAIVLLVLMVLWVALPLVLRRRLPGVVRQPPVTVNHTP